MNCIKNYIIIKALTLLVVFSLFIVSANAQTYHFDNYSVKEGLAQSSVYCIEQDKDGFIWLGTASGLSRFDGKQIINYTTEDGLADGAVKAMYIDSLGVIWLGHADGGVSRFRKGGFEVVFSINADVTSFSPDKEGNLWLSSFGAGVIKIMNPYTQIKDSLQFQQYKGQEGVSDLVYQIIQFKNGNIYFVTDVGIKEYNFQKNEFSFYKVKNLSAYFQITCMYESTNGDQWFGSYNGGLYHYKKKAGELKTYDVLDGLASNWISTINGDTKGNVWIGTWGGGVTKLNGDGILLTINKGKGLRDNKIRCIEEDREGNILIGTKETGLLVYKGSQFVSYGVQNGLINEQVWSIFKDHLEREWFGTNEGISVFEDNKVVKSFSEEKGLSFHDVRYIKQDKNNKIWIGTWNGGVMSYNEERDEFEINYEINSNMKQLLITAMDVDKSNNLWVGTTDGLVYYEIDNKKIAHLTQSNGLGGNDISTVFTDSKNIVWVGARGKGITRIDDATISKIDLKRKFTPTSIVEDKAGNLWIGTEGKGVLVFNGEKITKEYTVKNGLLSDYIALLNIDNNGNLWIGSNKGLNKYDVDQKRFYSYSEKEGYVGIESKLNATYKDNEGNLWFGTIKGAVKLNLKEETLNEFEPLTKISKLTVNLEEQTMINDLKLNYKKKSIVFHYSSICLSNPNEVYYQVMLEGLDDGWGPKTKQNFITYSPLPPGEYTFKVKASNNNGVWNQTPEIYSFEIVPPLWIRPWFIVFCCVILVVLIIVFIKIRERNLLIEKKILEAKVEVRTEELVLQSKELERKNKDIIDSITYAKRIQDAILPDGEIFRHQLLESFIFFNPKDIVSGDFYWLAEKNDKFLFAAVDCTGHGVPGAFMSIVGYNLLDKIVGEYGVTEPHKILNELNKGVSDALRQEIDSDEINDGMDISLCTFDKQTSILEYSGAFNPLYIISKNKLEVINGADIVPNITDDNGLMLYEIKANRFPIGSYSEGKQEFSKHSIKLKKGDTVYLFSDGYADQFGGPKGKKFRYKQFKQLLLSINSKSMEEQYQMLNTSFSNWRGDLEQVDDVIVIGSRL